MIYMVATIYSYYRGKVVAIEIKLSEVQEKKR